MSLFSFALQTVVLPPFTVQAPAINQFARGLKMNRAKAGVLGQEQEHLHQQRQQQRGSENGHTIPEDDITEGEGSKRV